MIAKELIESMLLEKISGTEVFLVDILIHPGNNIEVYVDTREGISLDKCAEINKYLVGKLDKDIEDYNLEVSSPGLGAPLKVPRQFDKNLGKEVEIIKKDGIKLKVRLLEYFGDYLEVEQQIPAKAGSGSKKTVAQPLRIDIKDIKSIKTVISFK
jgi:ribosome maturation factor RimP